MDSRSATGVRSSEGIAHGAVDRAFFDRPTVRVARELLGMTFGVRDGATVRSVRLVETEAYVAGDPANHAFRGPTPRNRSMFLGPGTLYVYRIHQVVCANLVTRAGEAVLLRAGEPLSRGLDPPVGPGRLCRALGIRRSDDGADLCESPRFVLAPGRVRPERIVAGGRVGIRRGAERPLRFALAGSPWVSRPRPGGRDRFSGSSPTNSRGAGERRRSRTRRRPLSAGGRSDVRTDGR